MESQLLEKILKILPEELTWILVIFIFIVLFYPKLASFVSHLSPRQRAIRKARERKELETLGVILEPEKKQTPTTDKNSSHLSQDLKKSSMTEEEGKGVYFRRLKRLHDPCWIWCFSSVFMVSAMVTIFTEVQLASHLMEVRSSSSYLPYFLIFPKVLIFSSIYSYGVSALGVMFFGNRGRWGNVLLGIGLATGLMLMQQGIMILQFR